MWRERPSDGNAYASTNRERSRGEREKIAGRFRLSRGQAQPTVFFFRKVPHAGRRKRESNDDDCYVCTNLH